MKNNPDVDQKAPRFLEGSLGERVIVAMASPPLTLMMAYALIALHTLCPGVRRQYWRGAVMDYALLAIFSELLGASFVLLVLAFFWALFRPVWIERALLFMRDHVWHSMWFFVIGFFVSLAICLIVP